MRRPVRPSTQRPAGVTRRSSGDTAAILVRVGDKVLGSLNRLQADAGGQMSGSFTHRPAFVDFSELFDRLERVLAAGEPADAIRAEIAERGIEVWHATHDMRLDQPGSLSIGGGEIKFRATDAFLTMRTGGLG